MTGGDPSPARIGPALNAPPTPPRISANLNFTYLKEGGERKTAWHGGWGEECDCAAPKRVCASRLCNVCLGACVYACMRVCVCVSVGKYTCAWGWGGELLLFFIFLQTCLARACSTAFNYLFIFLQRCIGFFGLVFFFFASTKETRAKIGVGESCRGFPFAPPSPALSPVGNSPAKRNAFALSRERRRAKRQKWQPGMTEGGPVSSPPLIPARREALRDRDKIYIYIYFREAEQARRDSVGLAGVGGG